MTAKDKSRSTVVGEALRKARKLQNLTQEELAKRSGIDRATISQIENNREEPRLDTIERLAEALRISPAELWLSASSENKRHLYSTPDREYEPLQLPHLHPGLEELLKDEHTRLMLGITEEEEQMLRSIRTRSHEILNRDFFVDVLISYRRHYKNETS
ncbi:helix-turn-helix domain-containing protein [bacterium]|nr:helix-turn-helix domain-containing protein [bacterium]